MISSYKYFGNFYIQKNQFQTIEEFPHPLMGIDDDEINKISSFYKRKLPLAYEEFLRIAGRNFFVAFHYGVIQQAYEYNRMVDRCKIFKRILIRENIYQGNEILLGLSDYEESLYIRFGEGENPPVYNVVEHDFSERHFESLVDFVNFQIEDYKSENG